MLVCQLLSSLRRKCRSLFCLVLSKLQPMLLLEKNSWLQRDLSACFHASLSPSPPPPPPTVLCLRSPFPPRGLPPNDLPRAALIGGSPSKGAWSVCLSAVLKAPAALSEPALPQLPSAFSLQWSLGRDRTAAPLQHNNIQGTFWGCFFSATAASFLPSHNICLTRSTKED